MKKSLTLTLVEKSIAAADAAMKETEEARDSAAIELKKVNSEIEKLNSEIENNEK